MDSLCEIAYGIDFFRIFTVMIVGPGNSVQSLNLRVERERWVRQWGEVAAHMRRALFAADGPWVVVRGRPGAPHDHQHARMDGPTRDEGHARNREVLRTWCERRGEKREETRDVRAAVRAHSL